jgi:methylated-DNA-[protein]-cysteine S-methyltransferase
MPSLTSTRIDTPLGGMHAILQDVALVSLRFVDPHPEGIPPSVPAEAMPVAHALRAFFEDATSPSPPPLHPEGTPFQQAVWSLLLEIPRGQTCSYSDIAQRMGRPNAVRAVAQAIARNPIHLFIPCHRVVGADGRLTGFAGGLWRKAWLLEFERTGTAPIRP